MQKVYVVYWSGTGNTQAMADAIGAGAKDAGAEVEVVEVDSANADDILAQPGFALGCPSMGAEELDESMEDFVASIEGKVSGKQIVLFGSYGWGDGEWMRTWTDRMTGAGATVVGGEGVIANETPDDDAVEACKAAGKTLAGL